MSRAGAGSQPLRSVPGNVFQNQQSSSSRSSTLGSGRLQNGKPGSTPTWAFGMGAGGPSLQSRSTNPSSFSQAIGTGHSHTPLDLSEFPSLSGAPQTQQQTAASLAAWGNSNARASPTVPSQRGLSNNRVSSEAVQSPSQSNDSQSQQQPRPSDPQSDSHTSPYAQIGALNDFTYGHGSPEASARHMENQGSSDDFPPLGGLGGLDATVARRSGLEQNSLANGGANGTNFASLTSRNGMSELSDSQHDRLSQTSGRVFSPMDGTSRATPMSRSSVEQIEQDNAQRPDQQMGGRLSRNSAQSGYPPNRLPVRTNLSEDQQTQRYGQSKPMSAGSPNLPLGSRSLDQEVVSQMNDMERWGMPGLVEILRGGTSEDQAALALGMDLSALGLDVHRPGNASLHADWAGPFADPQGRPPIPDFTLPQAYTVTNVPSLHSRISSFSDDTLFMIFYQMPRDESQEMAAQELYKRDWRWHKKLQQWMMKAAEAPEPRVDPVRNEERGWYYFWDANNWRRERREFLLSYEHLHHPVTQQQAEDAFASRS